MKKIPFKIVLVEPKIPPNTGNIVRLCSCTNSELYLIGELGFSICDKQLKRAGLDYWDEVKIEHYQTIEELAQKFPDANFYYLTTKAKNNYMDIDYKEGDFLVFGSETTGLPESLLEKNMDKTLRIPMCSNKRSLNLSNSVSIVIYEAIRQVGYFNN